MGLKLQVRPVAKGTGAANPHRERGRDPGWEHGREPCHEPGRLTASVGHDPDILQRATSLSGIGDGVVRGGRAAEMLDGWIPASAS